MNSCDSRHELSVVNLAITVLIQVLKDLLEPFFRQNWSPLSAFLTGHLTKQERCFSKTLSSIYIRPIIALFSYEPHLFHFLKTDFPILVGVHACKGCSQGLLTMCHLSRPGNFTMKKKYQRTLCVCYARCMSTPWYNARTGLACWRNFRCQPFGAECENMKILNILQPKYVHLQLPLWWFRHS